MRHEVKPVTLPAGKYFIGDPCYVLGHRWEEVCALHWADHTLSCNDNTCLPVYELDGRKVVEFHTAYGDGGYYDQFGACYGVDSGTIGAVPVELIDIDSVSDLGVIHVFQEDFVCSSDGKILRFGNTAIDTDPEPEEEEWEDDEDYYLDENGDEIDQDEYWAKEEEVA